MTFAEDVQNAFGQRKVSRANEEFLDFAFRLREIGFPVGREIEMLLDTRHYNDLSKHPVDDVLQKIRESRIADKDKIIRIVRAPEVQTKDWKIPQDSIFDHSPEFFKFITSINDGFERMMRYRPFELYIQQAEQWLNDKEGYFDMRSENDKDVWLNREQQRWDDNSLYWLNRLWQYKDALHPSGTGFAPYTAQKAQKLLAFLTDSMYNLFLAKARQIWFTTTMFGIALKRTIMRMSHLTMIVTSDIEKAKATFEDKLRAPFHAMPLYSRPEEPSTEGKQYLGFFQEGGGGGGGSRCVIHTASGTVINANSPNLALVDEIAIMDCLFDLINNWEPTAYQFDPISGTQKPKNQLVAWGSSWREDNEILNPEFEKTLRSYLDQFAEKQWFGNPVPVILNVWAKPGMTPQLYEQLKAKAYSVKGAQRDRARTVFHMNNPLNVDDMFITSADTIIPFEDIRNHCKRIEEAASADIQREPEKAKNQCKYGYFEPIFDKSRPVTNDYSNDVPYVVIGAKFIPTSREDENACIVIFRDPLKNWRNRYWKGNDPVANSSGHSYMAGSIWDGVDQTVSAVMYKRIPNHRWCYLQNFLLGIYYDPNILDLVENNAGTNYFDFVTKLGFHKTIVFNKALPELLQTTEGNIWGINNKGNTKRWIHSYLTQLIELHSHNIWIYEFFHELKTYIRKPTQNNPDNFKVQEAKYYYDDVIDAVVFSYICFKTFEGKRRPRNLEEESYAPQTIIYKNDYDENWNLIRVPVVPETLVDKMLEQHNSF